MKQNSSIFIFLFFASQLFAQIPAVTSTTRWQVYDGNSTWVPSALDFKNYCLSGLAGLLPAGGTTGQVPTKNSGTDYDYSWATPSGGGSDGNGIYDGSGNVPTGTVVTLDGSFEIDPGFSGFDSKFMKDETGYGDDGNFFGWKKDAGRFFGCAASVPDDNLWEIVGRAFTDPDDQVNGSEFKFSENSISFKSYSAGNTATFSAFSAGFSFNASGLGFMSMTPTEFKFTDSRGTQIGFEYAGDYSATIAANDRSILDVGTTRKISKEGANNVTTSAKNALTPSEGWEVYDTDLDGKCVYDGTKWVRLSQKLAATVSVGAGAGTGASATIDGTDLEGTVSLTGGTTASASATVFTITFGSAFSTAPKGILIVPFSDNAAALGSRPVYGTAVSTTTATASVGAVNVITNGVVYVFAYHVIQ